MEKVDFYVINSVDFGSTGRIAVDIFEKASTKFQNCFFICGQKKTRDSTSYSIFESLPKVYFRITSRLLKPIFGEGFSSYFATKKLLTFIKRTRKNKNIIFNLHNLHGAFINIPLLFKYIKKTNAKVVYTMHDCWIFTGGCAYYSMNGCEKWKNKCLKCQFKSEYPLAEPNCTKRNLKKKNKIIKNLDHKNIIFVSPSKWLMNEFLKSNLSNNRVKVINNGIKQHTFKCIDKEKTIFCAASPWTPRKGLNDVNKLYDLIGNDFNFKIAGLSEKDYTKPGIIRLPTLDKEKMFLELRKASFFVNTTYEDNFPTVNIESLSCGTPVITYKSGGSPEIIDKNTGAEIEQGNIAQMANEILRLYPNIKQISKECTKRATLFLTDVMTSNYLNLFEELI